MKKIYFLLIFMAVSATSFSQSVALFGQCLNGTIICTYVTDIEGKPAYLGTGTVLGIDDVEVTVLWIGAPDNLWVISFSGQPYYQNSCNTPLPPGTVITPCPWSAVAGFPCTGAEPLSVSVIGVLPVTVMSFFAKPANNGIVLNWKTAQETNNKGFFIQRSKDGQVWADLSFVPGTGNATTVSSYQHVDNLPNSGINYYRLRQENSNGSSALSQIAIATHNTKSFFTVSDNPGHGLYKITSAQGITELEVMDAVGKKILYKKSAAFNDVIDLSLQAPGLYWLRIKNGANQSVVKLIKL